ncbi:MAG: DUF3253 domain-containing protein [Archangium gephyra]|uniref:DUF3253 domain-containing protein n=1 Tax=Archangium gephyra TaxID=48 RepID=A0A2W5U7Y4_9BACT|nr:MAG: DUF3253 domain-containing protein [Archangium gephyra]
MQTASPTTASTCVLRPRPEAGSVDTGRVDLEAAILQLLAERKPGATICPSEVARAQSDDWRPLMEPVREAARSLVKKGLLQITQRGSVVDPASAKGPIRLRLK